MERQGGDAGACTLDCADQFRVTAFSQLTWCESLPDIESIRRCSRRDVSLLAQEGCAVDPEPGVRIAGNATQPINTIFDEQRLRSLLGDRNVSVISIRDVFQTSEALGVPRPAHAVGLDIHNMNILYYELKLDI